MSDKIHPLRLAELLSARMSHDLGGVIGTIAAALDLVVDAAPDPSEPLLLATEAADELRARLRLVRAAWGPSGGPMTLDEFRGLASGAHDGRLTVNLALPAETVFPPDVARIVLNLVMLAQEALPGGGVLSVTGAPDDLVVNIVGPRAAWPPGLAACLASEANAWAAVRDARTLQTPLTVLLAHALGLRLSLLVPAAPGSRLPMLRLSKY